MTSSAQHSPSGGAIWPSGVAACDFDGDGKVDVVTANSNDSNVSWFTRDSDISWPVHSIPGPASAHEALAADLDGDGVAELVVAYGTPSRRRSSSTGRRRRCRR